MPEEAGRAQAHADFEADLRRASEALRAANVARAS